MSDRVAEQERVSEAELLRRIALSEDREAFRELYGLFCSRVYNTALSYVQNAEDAAEVTQDVFLQIHRSASSFNGNSSVATWVYRITVNRSLDHVRYLTRQKRQASILSIFGAKGELVHDAPDFDHPGVQMENREDARQLFAAVGKLPENQRTAFILTQIEDMHGKEAAEVMQISVKALESLIQRAKANLRKYLEKSL